MRSVSASLRPSPNWAKCADFALAMGLVLITGCREPASYSPAAAPVEFTNSVGMRFVRIPPGEFLMGATADDPNPVSGASIPQHRVRITTAFYMAVNEVTRAKYELMMRERTHHPVPPFFSESGGGRALVRDVQIERLPIDHVSWNLAAEQQAGRAYRLPTEAEWEYACRGGTTTRFSCGDQITPAEASINAFPTATGAAIPLMRVAEVGSYAPNQFGLFDMHGNVWEWCRDSMRAYTQEAQTDPVGPDQAYRVLRGGAWDMPAAYCRSDYRTEALSGYVFAGIRVVCEVE